MKKVSIIIPVYNGEKFLKNCFQTLENQTIGMERLECIFINDASDDGGVSWDMLTWFEQKHPESVCIIDSKENHRVGGSRNIGLSYATGDYIAFMDQDDSLHPEMLKAMSDMMDAYECDVVMCRYRLVKPEEEHHKERMGQDYILDITDDKEREKLLATNQLGYVIWDKMYKRELIFDNDIHFPDNRFFEDTYFSGLVSCYAGRIGVLNETYYFYLQYDTSTNVSMTKKQRDDLLIVNNDKWDEFVKRGMYDSCKMAVEYDYIRNYYLGGLKNFAQVYQEIPYELLLQMQQDVSRRISKQDYSQNIYLQQGLNEHEKQLLEIVWQ